MAAGAALAALAAGASGGACQVGKIAFIFCESIHRISSGSTLHGGFTHYIPNVIDHDVRGHCFIDLLILINIGPSITRCFLGSLGLTLDNYSWW